MKIQHREEKKTLQMKCSSTTNMDKQQSFLKGELEVIRITPDLYQEAEELFISNFLKYENVAIACNLLGSQQSLDEMKILLRATLDDGISFAARHCSSNKLVAMSANKIVSNNSDNSLEDICSTFTSPSLNCVNDFLTRMECSFDIFKEWQIDSIFEVVFLATHKDFSKRGLAIGLTQYSIDFASKMLHGELTANELEMLPEHVRGMQPKAVTSVFTSKFTQRIGEKLDFQVLHKISYSDFSFEGKTFAEKIDPLHECSTFAALKL